VAIILSSIIGVLALSGVLFFVMRQIKKSNNSKAHQLAGALASKNVQSEILIQSITDGIMVVDTSTKVNLINNAASEMTGWPVKEALNIDAQMVLRLIADEKTSETIPDNQHPFTLVLQKRERYSKTLQLLSRNNKKMFISLVISPVIVQDKNELVGAIAVFRDVTNERTDEARRAEFISTASHEMRTPVAAIEGYLALALNEKTSTIDARARDFLEKARSSTQHLGQLFQDLLTSAKAEDGRLSSHPVIVEMSSYIEQLAQDLRFGAEKKNLEMEFVLSSPHSVTDSGAIDTTSPKKVIQPLYYVQVDPDRMREVITNLFDNAVKYTDSGKITLSITGNKEVVQIRIADTGNGIPAEDLPHLFQKFYRVDNTATRTIGGTGLGLFICKKIVELYNGTIWAESKVGEGSVFYINLPRIDSSRAQQMQSQEKATPNI
jgi:two-component system, OmpR family, sensor histidine kinase VicK